MTPKIKIRQYVIFIKLQKSDTTYIKCFTEYYDHHPLVRQ